MVFIPPPFTMVSPLIVTFLRVTSPLSTPSLMIRLPFMVVFSSMTPFTLISTLPFTTPAV